METGFSYTESNEFATAGEWQRTEYGTIPALQLVCLWSIKSGYGMREETDE